MPLNEDKATFLRYEVGILTLKAALSTRDESAPIYAPEYREYQRRPFKNALRKELQGIELSYSNGRVAEATHCDYIAALADRVSAGHGGFLYQRRFRFGIAQKLVNLYLKYLWVSGMVEEPPHCPLDGIVRDLTGLNYDWTTSDSREEYEGAIARLTAHANPRSLAVWELQEFARRDQRDA